MTKNLRTNLHALITVNVVILNRIPIKKFQNLMRVKRLVASFHTTNCLREIMLPAMFQDLPKFMFVHGAVLTTALIPNTWQANWLHMDMIL